MEASRQGARLISKALLLLVVFLLLPSLVPDSVGHPGR